MEFNDQNQLMNKIETETRIHETDWKVLEGRQVDKLGRRRGRDKPKIIYIHMRMKKEKEKKQAFIYSKNNKIVCIYIKHIDTGHDSVVTARGKMRVEARWGWAKRGARGDWDRKRLSLSQASLWGNGHTVLCADGVSLSSTCETGMISEPMSPQYILKITTPAQYSQLKVTNFYGEKKILEVTI